MKKHYELTYIVSIQFLDKELQQAIEKVAGHIKEMNGDITADQIIGKQKLAYPINKVHQGTYVVVEFDMEPEKVLELDGLIKLQAEVLRHLIISKKIKTEAEVKHEQEVQDRLRKEKEDELNEMEKESKSTIKKEVAPKKEVVEKPVKEKEVVVEASKEEDKKVETKEAKKVTMDDIDKKIDEILTEDII
jgi:small subunit ribosomal protein S6